MTILKQEKSQRLAIVVLLTIATVIAFAPVLNCGFVNYDDTGYVTKNPHVCSGVSLKTILWSFTATDQANWHPLTWMSHALDCTLFGLEARYHHAMNLFLHLVSSIVLFLVLERMTRAMWQSAFVALVFAIHPLHVESVAWISERKDVLSGLFWMLTMSAYVGYVRSRSPGRYVLTVSMFALGLQAKPMLVSLPFVLILLDYWPLRRYKISRADSFGQVFAQFIRSLREKIPFFVLSLLSCIVTYLVQQQGGSMASSGELSMSDRIANAVVSYAVYIWKAVLPTGLAIFYPHSSSSLQLWQIGLSVPALTLISVFVWTRRIEHSYIIAGWLWFLGTLVPVIGIVQVGLQAMADRYMYIPIIGLSIMAAWGIPALLQQRGIRRHVLAGAFVLVTAAMVVATRVQAACWKDSFTLFEHALEVTSGNHIAHNNLGAALEDSGRHAEALVHLREALRLRPDEILIHKNLARSLLAQGDLSEALDQYFWVLSHNQSDHALQAKVADILADEGKTEEAVQHYREAIRLDSTDVFSRCRLGQIYVQQMKFDEAKNQCLLALKQQPGYSKAHDVLGIIAVGQQKNDDAIGEFVEAIHCDSTNADAYNDLGILYDRMGDTARSLETYRLAVRSNPRHWNAQFNLGTALAKRGQLADAETHWLRAVELNPNAVDARTNLGRLYTMRGKIEEANMQFSEALRIDSNNVQSHYNYGNLLTKLGKFNEAEFQYSEAVRLAPNFQPARSALLEVRRRNKR